MPQITKKQIGALEGTIDPFALEETDIAREAVSTMRLLTGGIIVKFSKKQLDYLYAVVMDDQDEKPFTDEIIRILENARKEKELTPGESH